MSHKATEWAFSIRDLSSGEFRVLVNLADCHNPTRGCFPSGAYLREACEMSNGALYENLNRLEAKGHIKRVQRGDQSGNGRASSRYILGFEATLNPETGVRPDSGIPETGGGQIPAHRTPDSGPPETEQVREPVREEEPVKSVARARFDATAFQAFWDTFPHRNGKKDKRPYCEEKFAKAVKSGVDPQAIVRAAQEYQDDDDVKRGYGRAAATWLHQRGWEDERAPSQPTFHDQIDDMLKGPTDDLRRTDAAYSLAAQWLPKNLEDARTPDERNRADTNASDGGGYEQEVASVLRPGRFGGSVR